MWYSCVIASAILALGMFFSGATCADIDEDVQLAFEAYADDYVETVMKTQRLPGVGVGLVTAQGLATFRGYGFANVENRRYVTRDTLFYIASLTKLMTAAMIVQRHRDRTLDVTDTLTRHLPNTTRHSKRGSALGAITLEQLLTHRSGLPRWESELSGRTAHFHYPGTCERLLREYGGFQLDAIPGSQFSYSNLGFVMLGMVLEHDSGDQFELLIDREIFRPLRMFDSGVPPNKIVRTRLAQSYSDDSTPRPLLHWKPDCFSAAGGVVSSVNDLALFLVHHMGQSDVDSLARVSWGTKQLTSGDRMWMHSGSLHGFRSWMGYSETDKLGVIIWTNRNYDIENDGEVLLNEAVRLVRAQPISQRLAD